jgi:hypothetical protein
MNRKNSATSGKLITAVCVSYLLPVFERNILRELFGTSEEVNGIWRIETNKELDELMKRRNIKNYVKSTKIEFVWTHK